MSILALWTWRWLGAGVSGIWEISSVEWYMYDPHCSLIWLCVVHKWLLLLLLLLYGRHVPTQSSERRCFDTSSFERVCYGAWLPQRVLMYYLSANLRGTGWDGFDSIYELCKARTNLCLGINNKLHVWHHWSRLVAHYCRWHWMIRFTFDDKTWWSNDWRAEKAKKWLQCVNCTAVFLSHISIDRSFK